MNTRRLLTASLLPISFLIASSHVLAKEEAPAVVPVPTVTRALPYKVTRIAEAGPLAGVVVTVDLTDPRVRVKVALTDDRDPDGDGACVGQLDTTSQAARKHDFAVTINASFFAVPKSRDFNGKTVRYFVGNCGYPVGWHLSQGKVLGRPVKDNLRATLVINKSGKVSIRDHVKELPADAAFAVSGNAMILYDGKVTRELERGFAPTTAVGISADGKTLYLAAIDGRQEKSRGASLDEMAAILLKMGAWHAINFDGGGSTTMVLKDPATGVFATVNQPSDVSSLGITQLVERAVIDVIGIAVE
jgi:exopolysaccharide biosynthesis protein